MLIVISKSMRIKYDLNKQGSEEYNGNLQLFESCMPQV